MSFAKEYSKTTEKRRSYLDNLNSLCRVAWVAGQTKPKFGSWIMCLAAKDAKTAKNMQSDMVFGGLYTGRQIDMISPTG